MDRPGQKLLLSIVIFLWTLPLSSVTLQEKLLLNKTLSNAYAAMSSDDLNTAQSLLLAVKKNHADSEFATIADYYMALLEYHRGNNYPALYYIELALSHCDDKRLYPKYCEGIIMTAGIIYKETGLIDKAIYYLDLIRNSENTLYVNTAELYLSYLYFDAGNKGKAQFYYRQIIKNLLGDKEKEIYDYLGNYIGWSMIATKTIGYGDPNVSCIYAENDTIYIGLWHGGLIIYNYILDTYRFVSSPTLPSDEIRSIVADKDTVWIGTTSGVAALRKRDSSITIIDALSELKTTTLILYQESVFIGTLGSGVVEYIPATEEIHPLLSVGAISALYKNEDGLLIATYDKKLYLYHNHHISDFKLKTKLNKPITAIARTGEKYCFATYGAGLLIYDTRKKEETFYNKTTTPLIKNDYFLTAAENRDIFYCGSLGNGIYCVDRDEIKEFKVSDYYTGNDIQKIFFYNDLMFIATLGEGVLMRNVN